MAETLMNEWAILLLELLLGGGRWLASVRDRHLVNWRLPRVGRGPPCSAGQTVLPDCTRQRQCAVPSCLT